MVSDRRRRFGRVAGVLTFVTTAPLAWSQTVAPIRASQAGAWRIVRQAPVGTAPSAIRVQPSSFRLASLDHVSIEATLANAPLESTVNPTESDQIIELPMPDGTFARFRFVESPILAPELAAKFPDLRTFLGQGVDDPTASVRFDLTPKGFHAQILSPSGAVYIDPYLEGNVELHASYYKRDYRTAARPFQCLTSAPRRPRAVQDIGGAVPLTARNSGEELRTYRLACAATGEYTQFHGGTVPAGMSAILTAINRVNGIYEVEIAARMELVANNDLLIYTDGSTDPYTNNSGFTMLGQNQATVDSVIGSANYDIGHVFSTGGGGVAGLGVVCVGGAKARGVTGLANPIGDGFYVDFVAHEIGHQFGGNHSFNGISGNCCCGNRNGSTAYERGSGSTIMAYAGICGPDDLQPHSDPYFHAISFDEMRSFITAGSGSICPVVSVTGNDGPSIDAGPGYTIPHNTPFALTPVSASDPNGDPLTYCWEELDLGPGATLSSPDDGQIPLFRSFNPTSEPTRTFPQIADLLSGTASDAEKLPTTNRTMQFRVTARDNRAGGGGVAFDELTLSVNTGAGPFVVTSPSTSIPSGTNETVSWSVAGTDLPPVSVSQVNILLSLDAGLTFPIVLASSTPNDGEEVVAIPAVDTSTAQIKVEAVGNVFFAVTGVCPIATTPTQGPEVAATSRFLTMRPGSPNRATALRVTLSDIPAPAQAFEGAVLWVGAPHQVCENSGNNQATPLSDCGPAPGLSQKWYWAAPLVCDHSAAGVLDWTTLADHCVGGSNDGAPCLDDSACSGGSCGSDGLVHVYHSHVIPSTLTAGGGSIASVAQYDVQALDVLCSEDLETNYSAPLSVPQAGWGDIGGQPGECPHEPPDLQVSLIGDVTEAIRKFSNLPCAPIKSRVDMDQDFVINFTTDVIQILNAFTGGGFPFPPESPPCP